MNLEYILSAIVPYGNEFELSTSSNTIRYIEKKEYEDEVFYYTEPNFSDATPEKMKNAKSPKFILFSAAGATGKTALAKCICYKRNGIYWDLPDDKVAEHSCEGAIANAVGFSNLSPFIKSLENGHNFLVIDAFDEAEAGSGRTGIEYFLRDLNKVTENCDNICAILLARTETAVFIKNYLLNNNIPFKHYEIGYFAEYNAKTYILKRLEKDKTPITDMVKQCIDEQFREIQRIFGEEEATPFLGYAPVLDALAVAYDTERNTLNLLKKIEKGDNSGTLVEDILKDLMIREQKKFIKALQVRISDSIEGKKSINIYNNHEQFNRLLGKLLFNDETSLIDIPEDFPVKYHEEYIETIRIQLPQHPFIVAKDRGNNTYYEFAGAAFRDYVLAYLLADDSFSWCVDEYISEHPKYCPSQLLIEFYSQFSDNKLSGKYIPIIYNSFKAHAHLEDEVSMYVNGDENECSVEFLIVCKGDVRHRYTFDLTEFNNGIYIQQLTNCYIDVGGSVYVGDVSGEARINNSTINCNEIIWRSENIAIEAYSPGECLISAKSFKYQSECIPKFEVKTDNDKNLRIAVPSLREYYKLIGYKCDDIFDEASNDKFNNFANLLRRIFSCMRSHSKDAPAKKKDYIDNIIINQNSEKQQILEFLIDMQIIYIDEQNWLYKLDLDKLSEFSVNWNDIRMGHFEALRNLYSQYISWSVT